METVEKKQRILSKTLGRLKQKEHLPQELIYLLGQTAELQLTARQETSIELPDLDLPALKSLVAQGGSYLSPETLPLDRRQVADLFSKIIEMITSQPEKMPDTMTRAVAVIEAGLKTGELDLEKAVEECLKGEGAVLSSWAERTPEAPEALRFLILASLEPSLNAAVKALTEELQKHQVDDGAIRHAGTCPVCGNLPYILELREKEGVRIAACSLCRHEYRIRRLACPVCDTTDAEKIKYFTVEGETGFLVETCDQCNTCVKTIDFRSMDRQAVPAFNDLESLALDFLAADQGFFRPVRSVWGI